MLSFIIIQDPLCFTLEEMECVEKIHVDTSGCLKPCSGLIVTTFTRSEQKGNLENVFPIHGDYDSYKGNTDYPSGMQKGENLL